MIDCGDQILRLAHVWQVSASRDLGEPLLAGCLAGIDARRRRRGFSLRVWVRNRKPWATWARMRKINLSYPLAWVRANVSEISAKAGSSSNPVAAGCSALIRLVERWETLSAR